MGRRKTPPPEPLRLGKVKPPEKRCGCKAQRPGSDPAVYCNCNTKILFGEYKCTACDEDRHVY